MREIDDKEFFPVGTHVMFLHDSWKSDDYNERMDGRTGTIMDVYHYPSTEYRVVLDEPIIVCGYISTYEYISQHGVLQKI